MGGTPDIRILVLFCGGTLVMEEDERGSLLTPALDRAIENLLSMETRLGELAGIEVACIDNIDSSNIRPEHWDRVASVIGENYDDYDGFVVTHGTDTMAETAEALQGLEAKTIVLTGALTPARFRTTDAIFNVGMAVAAVQVSPPGVYIAMSGQVFTAGEVRKNRTENRFEAL